MADSPPAGALDGIRVLDLSTRLAEGTGRVLADLGAEVVKVEPPGGCDARFTPPFVDGREGEPDGSLFWSAWGLGKRSVVLDLEVAGDRERFVELARGADVLVESFVPGRMAALGLDAETLAEVNPALVYVSVTPFGQTTPDATSPANDLTLSAAGGLLGMQGDHDRPPVPVGFEETSMHGAVQAAADAILALYERNRSGRGQALDTSMQAAVVWALMFVTSYAAYDQDVPTFGDDRGESGQRPLEIRPGVRNPVIEPNKDGHMAMTLVIGAQGNYGFGQAMKWAAEEEALDVDLRDRDWSTWMQDMDAGTLDPKDGKRGLEQMLTFLESKTKAEIQREAVKRKLLIAPAYTAEDLFGDPQLASRDFWQSVGDVLHPGPFARLSGTPIAYRRGAPSLGQDQALLDGPTREPCLHLREGHPEGRRGIFDGLKVADFGWIAAGPLISKDLANNGATVLSFESQNRLDTLRVLPPWKDGQLHADGGHCYANMNQSKFGLACDYSVAETMEVVDRAIDWADVVMENYTPGTAERLGFGWEKIRARNPRAIMLSSCMRGQTGPEAKHTGFGIHGAALGGFIAITGWPDRTPQPPWGAYTDFISPRFALSALAAALWHRDATDEGQYIDVSQIEASTHFLEPMLLDYHVNGRHHERPGLDSPRSCPHGVYRAAGTERYLALACESDEQFRALQAIVPGLEGDASLPARRARKAELDRALAAWCAEQDCKGAGAALRRAGVPAYPVLRATDLTTDPQLVARDFFIELDHDYLGRMRFDGATTLYSATPARPRWAGPVIGQHTWEALRDHLGFSEDEIANLAAAGALS